MEPCRGMARWNNPRACANPTPSGSDVGMDRDP